MRRFVGTSLQQINTEPRLSTRNGVGLPVALRLLFLFVGKLARAGSLIQGTTMHTLARTVLLIGLMATTAGATSSAETRAQHESFKRTHLSDLASRRGANHRVWDRLIEIAIADEDREVITAILASRPLHDPGQPLALYRFDVYSLYRAKPELVVDVAREHFDGNLDCAVDLLVPQSQIVSIHDVMNVARRTETPSPTLRAFIARAREHYARISEGEDSNLKLEACW